MMENWAKHVSVRAVVVAVLLTLATNTSGESLVVDGEVTLSGGVYMYDDVVIGPTGLLTLSGAVTIICDGPDTGYFELRGGTIYAGYQDAPPPDPRNGADGANGAAATGTSGAAGGRGEDGETLRGIDGARGFALRVVARNDIVIRGMVDLRGSPGSSLSVSGGAGDGGDGGRGAGNDDGRGGKGGSGGHGGSSFGGDGGDGGHAWFESGMGTVDFGDLVSRSVVDLSGGDGGSAGPAGDGGNAKNGRLGSKPWLGGAGGRGGDGGDSVGGDGGAGGNLTLRGPAVAADTIEMHMDGGRRGSGSARGLGGTGAFSGTGSRSPGGYNGHSISGTPGTDGVYQVVLSDPVMLDVSRPGDVIAGTSQNYPGGDRPDGPFGPEAPINVIDNDPATKYLNADKQNSGFILMPGTGGTYLAGIALTTANDAPERDPAGVTITASHDGEQWAPIVTDLPTPLPNDRWAESSFYFTPETPGLFQYYRVTFPTLKDAQAANSMQIAEVRMIGNVPEPSSAALVLLGVAGIVGRARRKR